MKAYHVVGQAPMYTNTFLLISEGGCGAVIDPAAAAADYNRGAAKAVGRQALL